MSYCQKYTQNSDQDEHQSSELCLVAVLTLVVELHWSGEEVEFRNPLILADFSDELAKPIERT